MIIAIPTTDKISISDNPRESAFFKIVTFMGEELTDEEFRPNPLNGDNLDSPITMAEAERLVSLLSDCDIIITGDPEGTLANSPVGYMINTLFSEEYLITRAAGLYNEEYLQQERNCCCSP